MTNQTTSPANESRPANELARFRAWAVDCGHYPVTEAVDRYLLMQQTNDAAADESLAPANG